MICPPRNKARFGPQSGKVLIAAGYAENPSAWLSSAEQYDSAAGPITLSNPTKLTNGAFQFTFTGAASRTNTVLTSTNPALSVASWAALGPVQEFSPGLYLFSDSEAANKTQRFYSVRSP